MSTGTVTAPPSLTSPTGQRPLQLLDSNIPSVLNSPVSASALTSPRSSALGLSTPPPSARTFQQGNPRRQSSISYFPSDYVRPPGVRSPTAPSSPFSRPLPRRTASVGFWDDDVAGAFATIKRDRRSMGALTTGSREIAASVFSIAVDHGPLTLTEKHADLLQFIAQKEAKCLELRSQLEVHEAELSQLKRKWEKIVSRGMDRAYSSPGSSFTPASTSTVSSIIPSARDALKEGARLLAAGLNDFSTPDQLSQPSSSSVVSPMIVPMSGLATISRASIASQKLTSRHETTQSMSSVSTAASSTRTSTTQSSQRLSQSSASSLLSSLSLEDPTEESSSAEVLLDEPSVTSPIQTNRSEKTLRRRSQDKKDSLARSPLSPSPLADNVKNSVVSSSAGKTKTRPTSINLGNPASSSPVSTWMGSVGSSVGKKWEEMQKNDTFTKSQKRASILLSDVSQSLFAALTSPAPSAGPSPIQKPSPLSAVSSHSLLDEEPDQLEGQTLTLSAPLIPSVVSPSPSQKRVDEDEDEWNW
ncbi:hypothetical protein BDY19DRAFT_108361 [Irpex rosettiformis]|uniref:Uncharacterized protein n=1 Tax=Irpex rosettiformis TaxID=378272 RepID=A0ACB8U5C1_9APHY|nr:hypothetical protein BDY19DRAFT_108361 [Irpex rosettiformis]